MSAIDQCAAASVAVTVASVTSVTSVTLGGWEKEGDHALRHPTGWTIARYKTGDVAVYLLWSPANTTGAARTTGGMEKYGPFVTADAAKERHAELTRVNHG